MTETTFDDHPQDWNDPGRAYLYRSTRWHMLMLAGIMFLTTFGFYVAAPETWSMWRIAGWGVIAGLGSYLSLFVNWILVADW